jgi:hypothetical protein
VRHLLILFAIALSIPAFVFAQEKAELSAPVLEVPSTLEEAKEESLQVGEKIAGILPGIVENLWNTQVLPVWHNMAEWTKEELWQKRARPRVQDLIDKGKVLLGREVEQRRPGIEQELQEEKQELKEELQQHGKNVGKSFWERFKNLLTE